MSVCNIFKEISSNNGQGVFYTFSQYADDLTKENALQTEYRVIPKRFACLELEKHVLTQPTDTQTPPNILLNKALPQMLQNYYENVVSYYRRHHDNNQYDWNNFDASVFLWRALKDYGLVTKEDEIDGQNQFLYSYFNELKYVGDINIYANQDIQSTNYNEIYCMIPPEANAGKYKLVQNQKADYQYNVTYPYTIGISHEKRINQWFGDIQGISSNYPTYDSSLTGLSPEPDFGYDNTPALVTNDTYYYGGETYPMILDNWSTEPQDFVDIKNDDFFKFNTIIVFYDIVRTNSDESIETVYRNLPLGIWLSGNITETSKGILTIDNEVTKFVRSGSIFDQGTSYGLRICTKYISTPNGNMVAGEVVDHPDNYPEFSEVCDEFAQSMIRMNEILGESRAQHNELVDFITMFINKKVNVPYIKTINGRDYWFVNGKNTNVIAGVDTTYINNLEQQIQNLNVQIADLQQRLMP